MIYESQYTKIVAYLAGKGKADYLQIEAWIKTELDDIFGADGYPAEWVDGLENRESNV